MSLWHFIGGYVLGRTMADDRPKESEGTFPVSEEYNQQEGCFKGCGCFSLIVLFTCVYFASSFAQNRSLEEENLLKGTQIEKTFGGGIDFIESFLIEQVSSDYEIDFSAWSLIRESDSGFFEVEVTVHFTDKSLKKNRQRFKLEFNAHGKVLKAIKIEDVI